MNSDNSGFINSLTITGARVHNLKNIDVEIPHNTLTVITGLSGSGKSSLAFDTIYAEGQRRYIETFSSYARNMMGTLERPDVDNITGLSPVIAIEQKTVNRNPRSTIGTTTEIYDYLRLLFAKAATARSYVTGKPLVKFTEEKILQLILEMYDGHKIYMLAPVVKNRKGHYRDLFENLAKKGYLSVRVDGDIREMIPGMKVDRYKNHSIEVVVDKLKVSAADRQRLEKSIATALKAGDKELAIYDMDNNTTRFFSLALMDPETGISYPEPAPHTFSFNSPQGACPRCKGIGTVNIVDIDKIIPNHSVSIAKGGIVPLGKKTGSMIFLQIEAICKKYGCSLDTPIKELPPDAMDDILNGTTERFNVQGETMNLSDYFSTYGGIVKYLDSLQDDDTYPAARKWSDKYYTVQTCPECHGDRLNRNALHFYIGDSNIADLSRLDIKELYDWTGNALDGLDYRGKAVGQEIIKEIRNRLKFLLDVGLGYLSLNRASASLSGGESQRIRLATQMGSELVNVLYILDEPSIGLHQSDNRKLINSLKLLRDVGNSVIVVEHDKEMMVESDYIVDIGPLAGRKGGYVVFQGTPEQILDSGTLTADYLKGIRKIEIPSSRREGNGKKIELLGCTGHNLRNVDFRLPLGKLVCIAGVSGSGKSSLINGTLQPALTARLYHSLEEPLPFKELKGIENIDKVITVDQSPLGKSPRSNPSTYTGLFADIRNLFVSLPEARIRGYKPGRFSFNVAGGRCETCKGNGYRTIEMNFLPDIMVPCEECGGKRYNRETLEVRYKGRSIADVLDMTINQAVEFFENIPNLVKRLKVLQEIGLGYIKLGQPSSTLSGGENQRVKLASELSRKDTGQTLYLLDEPTTGLHFDDIKVLMNVLNKLVDKGNTIVIIEHNLDVVKQADYIFDMGPLGGRDGGMIVAEGTPEEIAYGNSPTAPFLREEGVRRRSE